MRTVPRILARYLIGALLMVAIAIGGLIAPAGAQYGNLAGLFVITSPTNPNQADFTGLGCAGGVQVVLYMPGVEATSGDPIAATPVPGRVLAVTTSVASADPLLNGTFNFNDVTLPTDIPRGIYEVHARCGGVDLVVLVELGTQGVIVIQPADRNDPILDQIQNPTGALAFSGRESNRTATYGLLLVGAGLLLVVAARRQTANR